MCMYLRMLWYLAVRRPAALTWWHHLRLNKLQVKLFVFMSGKRWKSQGGNQVRPVGAKPVQSHDHGRQPQSIWLLRHPYNSNTLGCLSYMYVSVYYVCAVHCNLFIWTDTKKIKKYSSLHKLMTIALIQYTVYLVLLTNITRVDLLYYIKWFWLCFTQKVRRTNMSISGLRWNSIVPISDHNKLLSWFIMIRSALIHLYT